MKRALWTATLVLAGGLLRAEPTIGAKVSANEVALSDTLTLTVEVTGINNVNEPPAMDIPDFVVQRAGRTQSFQWINGQTSSLIGFNYVLTPTRVGTLQIPAITLNVDGKPYSTQAIAITVRGDDQPAPVTAGSGTPGSVSVPAEGLKPVFITATVDTDRPFVGQQVLLRVQFLKRPDVRLAAQPNYSEPEMNGFLVEALGQQSFNTNMNGTPYEVTEVRYALFPTSDGEFLVGSAQIEAAVRTSADPFDPEGFFQNFFGRSQVMKLKTRALPLQVRALPRNKPDHFSGAVGRFRLNARTDTTDVTVGKPFNLILTVEGAGNIKSLKEPWLPDLTGFRRYETLSSSKMDQADRSVRGTKEFKILLIPQVSGKLAIPRSVFSYFDPAQADYVVLTSPEMELTVRPGSGVPEPAAPRAEGQPSSPAEGVQVVEKDIRFIKSGQLDHHRNPFYAQAFFWILLGLPPLFAASAQVAKVENRRRLERAGEYRSRGAWGRALKVLKGAQRRVDSGTLEDFFGEIQSSLVGFLADRWGVSAAGLRWSELESRLTQEGAPPDVRNQVRTLLDQAELARFGQTALGEVDRKQVLKDTQRLLRDLEKVV